MANNSDGIKFKSYRYTKISFPDGSSFTVCKQSPSGGFRIISDIREADEEGKLLPMTQAQKAADIICKLDDRTTDYERAIWNECKRLLLEAWTK